MLTENLAQTGISPSVVRWFQSGQPESDYPNHDFHLGNDIALAVNRKTRQVKYLYSFEGDFDGDGYGDEPQFGFDLLCEVSRSYQTAFRELCTIENLTIEYDTENVIELLAK